VAFRERLCRRPDSSHSWPCVAAAGVKEALIERSAATVQHACTARVWIALPTNPLAAAVVPMTEVHVPPPSQTGAKR
jgi:hypothetical protein